MRKTGISWKESSLRMSHSRMRGGSFGTHTRTVPLPSDGTVRQATIVCNFTLGPVTVCICMCILLVCPDSPVNTAQGFPNAASDMLERPSISF